MISTAVFYSPVIVTLLWHAVLLKDTHDRASVHHHRYVAVMAADTRIHHLVKAGDAAVLELLRALTAGKASVAMESIHSWYFGLSFNS